MVALTAPTIAEALIDVVASAVAISACEKGGRWAEALLLFSAAKEAERGECGAVQCLHQRLWQLQSLARGTGIAVHGPTGASGADDDQLQCLHHGL